jgi:hypothetical protein
MVTKLEGRATQNGQNLELLSYLAVGDTAEVVDKGVLVLSYVKGGLRATATGPCRIKLGSEGPTLLAGQNSQLSIVKPERRVGAALPSHLDISSGGAIRRGELALHLSRKLLPGEQRVPFSALPSFREFRLVVSNASTFVPVLTTEEFRDMSFTIPEGALEPGQSYEFLLQGTTDTGQSFEFEEKGVVVLSPEIAERLNQTKANSNSAELPEATELLALYLQYGLDQQALDSVNLLLKNGPSHQSLLDIRSKLETRLNYQTQ